MELFGLDNQVHPDDWVRNYTAGSGKDFLDEFYSRSPKRVTGFKIFTFHARTSLDDITAWNYLIEEKSIKCIILSRKDLLASFVSELRAKQTGVWHPVSTASFTADREVSIFVDEIAAEHYLYRVYAEMMWVLDKFSGHEIHKLAYENLASDFPFEMNRVFDFLAVPAITTSVRFSSLLGDDYSADVANFSELRSYLDHTIFAAGPLSASVVS